ncbi:cytochrome c oxidase assembly protein [Rhodococcus sp. PD04]|uniref:cytochrome c oxidase assembly protein n=1 Tax=Rhodococcus sp. PD04 TaxID=3109594 RepID=UPI002DD8C51B|nr:cytochrome c oxidase assembly protein [Rhodococcus sp. PD04]WSE23658.1 cytochrome c oxidase assembly protein [Rhodococcus sp. PD04]
MHDHPTNMGPGALALVVLLVAVVGVALYIGAAVRLRRRGDAWPWWRDASVAAGAGAVAAAVLPFGAAAVLPSVAAAAVVPLPGGPFTAHMAGHLLVGMVGPLLIVLGRPVTLLLRSIPVGGTRTGLLTVLHSRPAALLTAPAVAAVLDMGGLWVLYRTPLFAAMHDDTLVAIVVHLHVFAAGMLFTVAICRLDPLRRRYGLPHLAVVLLVAGAVHAVLAKTLYAQSPPGTMFAASDLQAGAQLMYYGGDAVGVALAVVLAVRWYGGVGRARHAGGVGRARARTVTVGRARRPAA